MASSSEYLYKLYQESRTNIDEKPIVILDNVHPEVFERILRYMYVGTCDVAELGPCGLKIRKEDLGSIVKKEKDNIDIVIDTVGMYLNDSLKRSNFKNFAQLKQ